jgi:hypothetical protein
LRAYLPPTSGQPLTKIDELTKRELSEVEGKIRNLQKEVNQFLFTHFSLIGNMNPSSQTPSLAIPVPQTNGAAAANSNSASSSSKRAAPSPADGPSLKKAKPLQASLNSAFAPPKAVPSIPRKKSANQIRYGKYLKKKNEFLEKALCNVSLSFIEGQLEVSTIKLNKLLSVKNQKLTITLENGTTTSMSQQTLFYVPKIGEKVLASKTLNAKQRKYVEAIVEDCRIAERKITIKWKDTGLTETIEYNKFDTILPLREEIIPLLVKKDIPYTQDSFYSLHLKL